MNGKTWVGSLALLGIAAQSQAQNTPADFLKGSMKKYANLRSFQADVKMSLPGGVTGTRSITYARPNHYRVRTKTSNGQDETSVCNGKEVNEYTATPDADPTQYPAPKSIATVDTLYMKQPSLCGSLLFSFFGGPDKISTFAQNPNAVTFGPSVTLDGQKCRVVKFMAKGKYGLTEIAIGTQDGLVRRISYGAPAVQNIRSGQKMRTLGAPAPTRITTTETFSHIVTDKDIAEATFDTKTPAPEQTAGAGGAGAAEDPGDKPPVAFGKAAPAFSVTALDGKQTKLSDLKGKIVLIDFWATWCPPCRKGLPETQKFFEKYADKGLAVMAISAEDKGTVEPFLKENNYSFPTYLDAEGKTNTAYGITGIPTVAVIDREGKLVAFMIGLQDPETILAALKKAGLSAE